SICIARVCWSWVDTRAYRATRMGDTKLPQKVRKVTVEFSGIRVSQIGGDKTLGRVDELFDDDPCCHEMNQSQKGLAQFLIPRGNTSELFEVVEEPFDLLA